MFYSLVHIFYNSNEEIGEKSINVIYRQFDFSIAFDNMFEYVIVQIEWK